MNCKQCREESLEAAHSGASLSPQAGNHRERCAACAQFFESHAALHSAFSAIADAAAPDASSAIERRVLDAFDARGQARPALRWWIPASATAAIALVAALVTIHRPTAPPDVNDAPFVEIPYTAPLAPYERTEVKRMDVSIAALIAAGFEVRASDAGGALPADVLFGQDGRAHAIRLVTNTERRIDQ